MKCTAEHLIELLSKLPKDRPYHYIESATKTQIAIQEVQKPFGPIRIKRCNTHKGTSFAGAKTETISEVMIRRVGNAISEGVPINFDRVLGASYNTRSALESLLAHTPEFYFCYPGRIQVSVSSTDIKKGHKHLLWKPNDPHKDLQKTEIQTDLTISELPGTEAIYEAVMLPDSITNTKGINIEAERMHIRIQAALVHIARGFGGRTYIAKNDHATTVGNKRFAEMDGVVTDLGKEALFSPTPEAISKAALIDCIWLRNSKFMPAVVEVEHSTGVTSGLNRMLGFKKAFIDIRTNYVIAAPDEDAEKVMAECARPQFKELNAAFLPYSNVHELYALEQKNRLKGVSEDFFANYLIRPTS